MNFCLPRVVVIIYATRIGSHLLLSTRHTSFYSVNAQYLVCSLAAGRNAETCTSAAPFCDFE